MRRGLTLVEVLACVGILVLLVAILVPVVGRARRQALGATCISNLRQWGQAAHSFATANNGYLPRRGQGKQVTSQISRPEDWFNALPPMMQMHPYTEMSTAGTIPRPGKGSSVWICPLATDIEGPNHFSYAMNMGLSVWDADENNGRPDNLASVGNTAVLVQFADGPGNRCSVFPSKTAGGYNPAPRHDGAVNICFLDGHVASFTGAYLGVDTGMIERPDVRWHPPNSGWNGAQ